MSRRRPPLVKTNASRCRSDSAAAAEDAVEAAGAEPGPFDAAAVGAGVEEAGAAAAALVSSLLPATIRRQAHSTSVSSASKHACNQTHRHTVRCFQIAQDTDCPLRASPADGHTAAAVRIHCTTARGGRTLQSVRQYYYWTPEKSAVMAGSSACLSTLPSPPRSSTHTVNRSYNAPSPD